MLFREERCAATFTLKMFLWLVVSLHTGQTLICAMGKVAVVLRVSVVPLATSCVLTVTSLSTSLKKEEVTEAEPEH